MAFNNMRKLSIDELEQIKSKNRTKALRLLRKIITVGSLLIIFLSLVMLLSPNGKWLYNEGNHRISNKI